MKREELLSLVKSGGYTGQIMFLSRNITLQELTKTEHRNYITKNLIDVLENKNLFDKLVILANRILQPIRDKIGSPLLIHSGYRCPELNKIIGSSDKSQHILAEAVDFHIAKSTPVFDQFKLTYETLKELKINYGQIIYEGTWIHLSLPNKEKDLLNQQPAKIINGKFEFVKF